VYAIQDHIVRFGNSYRFWYIILTAAISISYHKKHELQYNCTFFISITKGHFHKLTYPVHSHKLESITAQIVVRTVGNSLCPCFQLHYHWLFRRAVKWSCPNMLSVVGKEYSVDSVGVVDSLYSLLTPWP
jgi:hypothetical protein